MDKPAPLEQDVPVASKLFTNPWAFVPLLYFMQAIPVAIVQEVATIIFKDMGIANEPIARWTSIISLPWSLQLMLGPLVDLNFTKRKWILGGQALIAVGLIAAAFVMRVPNPFTVALVILGLTAVISALCNIATDGFYILSLTKPQQAAFVGVLTTSSRFGRLFCTGILVLISGLLIRSGMAKATAWSIVLFGGAILYGVGHLINRVTVPRPPEDVEATQQVPGETARNVQRTVVILAMGLSGYFFFNSVVRLAAHELWASLDGSPTGKLKGWMLPPKSDFFTIDIGLSGVQAELLQLVVCAAVAVFSFLTAKRLLRGTPMEDAFKSFVAQDGIIPIFFFILFYRFGEAMVAKMSPLFLKDSLMNGGLAVPNEQLGVIKGLAGVVGIICGGLLGGYVVSKFGLRKSFWPLALAMHIPNLLYLLAASVKLNMLYVTLPVIGPLNLTLAGIDFTDQFGYGFGFAGYMVYIMYVAQRGHYKTSHYAIGTGMGALCIAIAGIVSGILQSNFGYVGLFTAVIFLTIPGMLTLLFIPLDEDRGSRGRWRSDGRDWR